MEAVPGAVGCFHPCWLGCLLGLQGSTAVSQELGASSGMCSDPNPKTECCHEGLKLNSGSFSQAVQTEISQVRTLLGKLHFWQNAFLKNIFLAGQVSTENVCHLFLFQSNLPIKVIHACYLIEGNGHTSLRKHSHRLSLMATLSCALLVIN